MVIIPMGSGLVDLGFASRKRAGKLQLSGRKRRSGRGSIEAVKQNQRLERARDAYKR